MGGVDQFRAECVVLGKKWLPGHKIRAELFNYDYDIGVAVETPTKVRHAVRGSRAGRIIHPPWWQFWKEPIVVQPITPSVAIAALAKWLIERDVPLAANEEPLE